MILGATILALNSAFNRAIRTKRIKPAHFLKYVQPTMVWLLDHGEGPLEGASGPQSCTIQVLDSFFGVSRDSQLGGLLLESRRYMLPRHRTLLEALDETSPVLRRFVAGSGSPRLLEAYNRCLELLRAWRVSHQKRGGLYIKADDSSNSYVSTGLLVQKGDKSALFEQSMEEHIQATDERLLENPWKGKELSFEHLFRFLSQEQKELLRSRTEKLRFEAGESIISQGDLFPGLFVLKGIDFVVDRGEFVAIVGQSGSGKSTLLNILGALDQPTSGLVSIAGVDISELDSNGLATLRNEKVGLVFQFHHLMAEFSCLENALMPIVIKNGVATKAERERVLGLMERVGVASIQAKKANQISGGQQQRVAVIRALAQQPALILADEPTGNLDSASSKEVFELMREMTKEQNVTFMMVTHDERLAQQADRIFLIEDGLVTVTSGGPK
ncbi:MAG: ATP-binding cassette domain-containing protein [Vulcanimicrobiota bacterium]